MRSSPTKISVVIPVYNAAAYLEGTLRSVVSAAARTDAAVEVVCVDDGSTDASGAMLDAFAAQNANDSFAVRVIHQPNGGEGSARNAGLAVATGEWIVFLDADDLWLSNILTCAKAEVAATPDADVISFRFLSFDDGSATPTPDAASAPSRVFDLREEIPGDVVCETGVFPTLFRRTLLEGRSFSSLPLGADRLYVAQILTVAKKVVLSNAAVEGYRVRAGSMARAAWNLRKIRSMLDYAGGSLDALTGSGRRVGRKGADYLASVLLSVAPTYLSRMENEAERTEAGCLWLSSIKSRSFASASAKWRFVRGAYLKAGLRASLRLARILRAVKVI